MPVTVTYPGVYVEEIPSGVRTITGVATSIGAFVDYFAQGPLDKAVQIFSFADFQRQFGGLDQRSEASYAIQQFFLNGGGQAYVVRTTSGTTANKAVAAQITLKDASGGVDLLTATASSPGEWGNGLRIDVDYGTTDPTTLFNLTVTFVATNDGKPQVLASETFRNLVIDPTKSNDAAAVVNGKSRLVALKALTGSAGKRPAPTGTTSLLVDVSTLTLAAGNKLDVLVGTGAAAAAKVGTTDGLPTTGLTDPSSLAAALQTLIRGVKTGGKSALPSATVTVFGGGAKRYLVIRAGADDPSTFLTFADSAGTAAAQLGLDAATAPNVQQYALGGPAVLAASNKVAGGNGTWDPATDGGGVALGLIGDASKKTGMYALLDTDLFNILCIPATMNLADDKASQVSAEAVSLCASRRAMYLLDAPHADGDRDTVGGVTHWLDAHASLRSRNAALYFPRVDVADPLNDFRLRPVAPSGTVAGLYARTDGQRGVWKAPAGTEASLSGVQKLQYKLTDPENGALNPLAINCLRTFPIYGPVCWGARTLLGADQIADDYKYVPVRRLALFIEESLFRGTQWVVFEPNAAPLWAQVRLNVGAFMQNLFRQGAFFGKTPQEAYFVQCDDKNNPQNTIDLGIINIAVGFAPLKPAEFVVIQIQQIAGDIAS